MIKIENVSKNYTLGTEKIKALDGIHLNIKDGKITGSET